MEGTGKQKLNPLGVSCLLAVGFIPRGKKIAHTEKANSHPELVYPVFYSGLAQNFFRSFRICFTRSKFPSWVGQIPK
jgi:hypothetical protein